MMRCCCSVHILLIILEKHETCCVICSPLTTVSLTNLGHVYMHVWDCASLNKTFPSFLPSLYVRTCFSLRECVDMYTRLLAYLCVYVCTMAVGMCGGGGGGYQFLFILYDFL